jgi:indole-3-acetate monooxygenase
MQVWEAIARIDSAAAWNLVMNQGIAAYAAWLPAEGADDLFSQGVPTIAGALFPSGQAIRVAGGWRVSGQVSFGSGCQNAQWLAMPMIEMANDQPKHNPETGQPSPFGVFFPKSGAKILDTWHTYGMQGSGSTDYAVQDLFVPEHLAAPVAPLRHPAPGFEGPLYRIWPWTAIIGEGTVLIGAAAAAVKAAVHLCRTKTPSIPARRCVNSSLYSSRWARPRRAWMPHGIHCIARRRTPTTTSLKVTRHYHQRQKSAFS